MTSPSILAANARADAVNTATDASAAVEASRMADTAALLEKVDEKLSEHHEDNKKEMKTMMLDVISDVFGPEESTYVVKNRVPLLCQSVVSMKESINEMKQMMKELSGDIDKRYASKLSEKITFGLVAMMGIATMSAILKLIFIP